MKNINISELFEIEGQEAQGSYIKTSRQEMTSHIVTFDTDIGKPSQYRDLINLLYMADENTEFNYLLNSGGGNLSTTMAILEAMKNSEAVIRGIIVHECHSAASILALNCHEIIVTDSANMMVHTASYGNFGSSGNVKSYVDFSSSMIDKLIVSTYEGFLTPDEIEDVKKGVEYWFDAEEIRTRLKNQVEFRQAKETAKTKLASPALKKSTKKITV